MARYRIVCTNQEPADQPPTHAHIVAVGTGIITTEYTRKWTLDEVLKAMKGGDTFYTKGAQSGKVAEVERYTCRPCQRDYIRSDADAVKDNNLDSLPSCS